MSKITNSGIQNALKGLLRAGERIYKASDKVAKGDVSPESLVETKLASLDVKAQIKNIKILSETEKRLLDEIA
jgi:hypothetical protein